jgi:hypothetical protein
MAVSAASPPAPTAMGLLPNVRDRMHVMPTEQLPSCDAPSTNIVVVSSPRNNQPQQRQGGVHPATAVTWVLRIGLTALGIWSLF